MTSVEFNWDIHHTCNYRCPYCFSNEQWEALAKMNRHFPIETWLAAWHRIYERYGSAHIKIASGEPFIYPSFCKLVSGLSKEHRLEIVTNLSCNKQELVDFLSRIDPASLTLYLSFHPLFEALESFIEKALVVKEKGVFSGVNFVAYPPEFGRMKYFKEKFENAGLNFCLLPFRGEYASVIYPDGYTEAEKGMINELSSVFSPEQRESLRQMVSPEKTKGRLCQAGQKYACIESGGTAYRCGESKHKAIGNFFDEDFRLLDNPLPCEKAVCPCEFKWLVKEGKT